MRLSQYFIPILKETPNDAQIISHRLMLRSGMVRQLAAGLYNWLPLGSKVLENVRAIIKQGMDNIGAQEIIMPCIQPADLWRESGRYDAYGKEMLRITDRHDHDMLFGPTNEEVVTDIFRKNVFSYKDLPMNLYQIQLKFRDEIRPRFGIMRGREFLMKDAYSFDLDYESAKKTYNNVFNAYLHIFKDLGINAIPVRASTGPIGGDLSHEFHIIADTGESQIFYDRKFEEIAKQSKINVEQLSSIYSAADEMHDPENCPIPAENIISKRGIEVGHIFYLGKKYSELMNAYIIDKEGKKSLVEMGCYGIGVTRVVGAIIESSHDAKGIIWPEQVAPFKVVIINLQVGHIHTDKISEDLYNKLLSHKITVLYDDKRESVGSKFATNDLIGTPWQVIVGPKKAANGLVELKNRKTGETIELSIDNVLNKFILN